MKSYVIPCPSGFRDAVLQLAARRGLSATDLAFAILTLLDPRSIDEAPDPGEPPPGDRDRVRLKSGPRKGRTLTRKPRLQVRLPAGLEPEGIRRALAVALEIDRGRQTLTLSATAEQTRLRAELAAQKTALDRAEQALQDLRASINVIAFDADDQAVSSTEQASYILGLPPGARLDRDVVKSRFRQLSRVFHPDRPTGDTARMSRLIEAARFLESKLPRRFEFKPVNGR